MSGTYRILVIEGDVGESAGLLDLLGRCGTERESAADIESSLHSDLDSALADYAQARPDLVIFGPVAARGASPADLQQLRAHSGLEPVPILFVKHERETLSGNCLDTGCDDVLIQPYNPNLVQLKLAALRRFSDFSRTLVAQRDRIRKHHASLLYEQANARQIFDNLGDESCLDRSPAIRYHLSPRAVLNGDLLAAAFAPGDKLVLLLGDFTGHGLAAAVGAVPLTSIFYSMVPRGFSFSRVLREINGRLHGILPRQMFCCAVMVELDLHRRTLRLFNGGMPRACLRRASGELRLFESRHLPLGVLAEESIEEAAVVSRVEPGDRLYLWSDGIHEARNRQGELFGEQRLLRALNAEVLDGQRFEHILAQVNTFAAEQQDDLSLVEIDLGAVEPSRVAPQLAVESDSRVAGRIGNWSINFTLGPEELREGDPLPLLHGLLGQVPGAWRFQDDLSIVLGELFRNALEHGLLQLDSALKQTEQGFVEYYRQLLKGRRQLRDGWIRIALRCRDRGDGGELEVELEDSGAGIAVPGTSANDYSGRGLPLLRAICRELELSPGSSKVRALICWGATVQQTGEAVQFTPD